MPKTINSVCICGEALSKYKDDIVVILPCQHLIHMVCITDLYNREKIKMCPYCETQIKTIHTTTEIKKIVNESNDPKYYQIYVDMMTMSFVESGEIGYSILYNFPAIFDNMGAIYMAENQDDGYNILQEIFDNCNIQLRVKNRHKLYSLGNTPKVYIANHSSPIDSLIIHALTRCGFLASVIIKNTWMGRKIGAVMPLVMIDRGKNRNYVEKLRKYMKESGDIGIFPEGKQHHPKTLMQFRTGAFHTGYPVVPMIIRYKPFIYDNNVNSYLMKIYSQKRIMVYVDVLDPEFPPFNNRKIEKLRHNMAKVGNMALSRVSNRDITDC